MNIYDISKQANVSIATVSRVLNNSPHVSDKTRKKVLDVIEASGYTPNAFARGLGAKSTKIIGILCADSSDIYLANAIFHLEKALRQSGYDSLLCCTGYDLKDKQHYLELLLAKKVDAAILVGSHFVDTQPAPNQYLFEASKQIPLMLINGHLESDNIYSTLCDDYHAMLHLTHDLMALGKQHFIYLHRALSYSGQRKKDGFLNAYNAYPLTSAHSYTMCLCEDMASSQAALTHLYKQGIPMDCIIACDDELAIGAVKFAKAHQLAVPEELSIMGYNNSKLADCCDPELSSIDSKIEQLSLLTVSHLMNLFDGVSIPHYTLVPSERILRKTTSNNLSTKTKERLQ